MTRISYKEIAPGAYQAMLGLERYVGESGLEHSLLERRMCSARRCSPLRWAALRTMNVDERQPLEDVVGRRGPTGLLRPHGRVDLAVTVGDIERCRGLPCASMAPTRA